MKTSAHSTMQRWIRVGGEGVMFQRLWLRSNYISDYWPDWNEFHISTKSLFFLTFIWWLSEMRSFQNDFISFWRAGTIFHPGMRRPWKRTMICHTGKMQNIFRAMILSRDDTTYWKSCQKFIADLLKCDAIMVMSNKNSTGWLWINEEEKSK